MVKLYKVRTHGEMLTRPDRLVGYDDITIHWFSEGRMEPAFPYTWTIPGWEDMVQSLDPRELNPAYAKRLAAYVDQLFTFEEAIKLRAHFQQTRAATVELEEIDIPIVDFEIPYRLIPPEPEAGQNYGFLDLTGVSGSALPFKVTGYFDADYPSPFERYQVAAVKSLMESSGLSPDSQGCASTQDLYELCDKLNSLRLALLGLQQNLNVIMRKSPTGEQEPENTEQGSG